MKKLFKKSVSLFMIIALVAAFTASLAINSSALECPAEKSTSGGLFTTNVKNEQELRDAINDDYTHTIKLDNDICVHGDLNIDYSLGINLNNHSIIFLDSQNGININAKADDLVLIYSGTVQGAIDSSAAINVVSGNLGLSYSSVYGGNCHNNQQNAYGNALACLSKNSTVYIVDSKLFCGNGYKGNNDRQGKAIYDVVGDLSNIYQIALY